MVRTNVNGGLYGKESLNAMRWAWLQYPWINRAVNSYADRMRVDNFSPSGNVMFHEMMRKAILGSPVFFIMQTNGRVAETNEVKVPVQQSNENDTPSVDSENYVIRKEIVSGLDPVDVDKINNWNDEGVEYIDYEGHCYNNKGKLIPDLYCIKLYAPPITQQAVELATGAQAFDRFTMESMKNITIPTPYISGIDNDAKIGKRQSTSEERYDSEDDGQKAKLDNAVMVPSSNGTRGGTPIKADVGILEQWDSQKMFAFQQSKAIEFIGETKVPPVDFPETNALGQTAQALVSNREPFVSRVATIKQQFEAVFNTAGIPELSWQLLFPYTPQDIASIGDAAGKGVDSTSLRDYGNTLA